MGCIISTSDCAGNTVEKVLVSDEAMRVVQQDTDPALRVCISDGEVPVSHPNVPGGLEFTVGDTVTFPDIVMSLTLTVVSGSVNIVTPNGVMIAPTGSTYSWGDGDYKELDVTGLSFSTNSSDAVFQLHWEEKVTA